jgi:hypothetical protein
VLPDTDTDTDENGPREKKTALLRLGKRGQTDASSSTLER